MSTHKLNIETGRYYHLKKDLRLCTFCSKARVESENHFIFECNNYREERSDFLGRIADRGKNGESNNIIKWLFQKNNLDDLNEFGKFLDKCWEKRTITNVLQELINSVEKNCISSASAEHSFLIQPLLQGVDCRDNIRGVGGVVHNV